jgi:hypothetical protein
MPLLPWEDNSKEILHGDSLRTDRVEGRKKMVEKALCARTLVIMMYVPGRQLIRNSHSQSLAWTSSPGGIPEKNWPRILQEILRASEPRKWSCSSTRSDAFIIHIIQGRVTEGEGV